MRSIQEMRTRKRTTINKNKLSMKSERRNKIYVWDILMSETLKVTWCVRFIFAIVISYLLYSS